MDHKASEGCQKTLLAPWRQAQFLISYYREHFRKEESLKKFLKYRALASLHSPQRLTEKMLASNRIMQINHRDAERNCINR